MRRSSGTLLVFAAHLLAVLTVVSAQTKPAVLPKISANENRAPAGKLDSGVLTLRLEVREGLWRPEPGDTPDSGGSIETPASISVYAFAETGQEPQMPGPLIRVPQGTELRVSVHNLLPTAVQVHGLDQHPGTDKNVLELAPGENRETRFTAGEPGSYLYWAATQDLGRRPRAAVPADIESRPDTEGTMSGAFIVDPPGASTADRIFVIQLWDKDIFSRNFQGALTINGASWPYTEHLQARLGQPEHWRILNASPIPHPMHLHGFYFHVDAVGDGETEQHYTPVERRMVVTETVLPGHTFDMTWTPDRPGNWIFHCHILDHMSTYLSPMLFGPDGPAPVAEHMHQGYGAAGMGMAKLVLGITVSGGDDARLKPVKADLPAPGAERHLIVRERPASSYVPAGPGFYLQGVSQQVGAVGPPLVITRGVRSAITVTNELSEPVAIHWHGLEIESYYDGVAGWTGTAQRTTPPIAPGTSFVAYMTPPRAGTFIYHTHWHNVKQLTGGMYGALLVLEPGQKYDPDTDKVFVLGRSGPNEMQDPLVLNGSPQPGMIVLLAGQHYRFRFVNITPNDTLVRTSLTSGGHPVKWRPIAKDGADLPPQQATIQDAVQPISVGETYDYEFEPAKPGAYSLHFASPLGSEVTQVILVVPRSDPISVFATARHPS